MVRGGFGLRQAVLRPALAVGGQVAAVVGEGFGKLTLRVGQSAAKQIVGVVALPVVGQAAIDFCVVTPRVVVEIDRLLAGGMDDPGLAGRG